MGALALVLMATAGAAAGAGSASSPDHNAVQATAGLSTFRADLEPLNRALAEAGYTPVSANATAAGFGFSVGFGPLQVLLNLDGLVGTRKSFGPSGREASVEQPTLSLGVGYAVYRLGVLSVLPSASLVAGDVSMEFDAAAAPLFADQLPEVDGKLSISRDILGADLALKAQSVVPIWRGEGPSDGTGKTLLWLVVSTTLGYRVQLSQADWRLDEVQGYLLRDGPDFDLNGPFVRVSAGVGLPSP